MKRLSYALFATGIGFSCIAIVLLLGDRTVHADIAGRTSAPDIAAAAGILGFALAAGLSMLAGAVVASRGTNPEA